MKKILLAVVVVVMGGLLASGCSAPRADKSPDLSWWPTSATPQPVKDKVRRGSWWWPNDNQKSGDADMWGNRGYIYVNKDKGPDAEAIEKLLLQDINFAYDKSDLTDTGKGILDQVAALLKRNPDFYLSIEGHTCSIGGEQYNYRLGLRRAESAMGYLAQQGIPADHMRAVSFGKTRLKFKEKTPQDYAMNRRVEFRVLTREEAK